jgi:hypothetical protein
MKTSANCDPGSFRDPSGLVFSRGENIFRSIFSVGRENYEAARNAGVYKELIDAGLLIAHEEIDPGNMCPPGTITCLAHPRVPMISYPWEWPFSMLRDAALLHLDVMDMLIPKGFWLRDASAFNIQFDGQDLRLIDTLSVGKRVPDSPWVAYGQFCSHFLAPLAMAAFCDIRMFSLWRNYVDGFPLDLAKKVLPARKKIRPGLFLHLVLHARYQASADRPEDIRKSEAKKRPKVTDQGLAALIHSLRRTIKGLKWKRSSRIWERYEQIRSYEADDVNDKSAFVEAVVKRLKPKMVWDFGANTGEFSLTAARNGAFVVSIDGDPACTEYQFQRLSGEGGARRILPLTMDLANPSPGLGWAGMERFSLQQRGPVDMILALALIHHLVLSSYVPLSKVAEWFASLTDHLLVEFVPPTDLMVQKLLKNRLEEALSYDFQAFQSAFGTFFTFLDQKELTNGRTLFLCKRK